MISLRRGHFFIESVDTKIKSSWAVGLLVAPTVVFPLKSCIMKGEYLAQTELMRGLSSAE